MASPFQAASALSSRAGCGRVAAPREQARPGLGEPGRDLGHRPIPNTVASSSSDTTRDRIVTPSQLPSSVTPYAAAKRSAPSPRTSPDLGGTPGERQAFDPVGVGVLARGERAVVGRQLAEHVVEGVPVATAR